MTFFLLFYATALTSGATQGHIRYCLLNVAWGRLWCACPTSLFYFVRMRDNT